jgi:hypothetical protein
VLATIAPYNAGFGEKFDCLFQVATAEIKSFAEALQEQGGSILGNVDGVDVTVEHIAAMEASELLKIEYSAALDKFRRVSKLKKTLEHHPPISAIAPSALLAGAAKTSHASGPMSLQPRSRSPVLDVPAMRSVITPQQISTEETRFRKVEESIRLFVRVADPKFRQVVPMRFFNLTLTPAEANAYCADYLEEKSVRASVARVLLRIVAVVARMATELEELKRAENSASLWKMHADSLLALLEVARALAENATRVMALADQQGKTAEAESVKISLQKLRDRSDLVVRVLAQTESQAAGV